jgi:ABC-2 type transport system ATP-binding protein
METAALAFEHVRKTFGTRIALADVSLHVRTGESFGLIGVNGAGKTTLIKCLLDFTTPDSGEIRIFGTRAALTAARRELAFLPERFSPPYYLTGQDFFQYMLALHGAPQQAQAIAAACEALDLDRAALRAPVRSLSKGMTQKLGLAACLLSGKRLYVLDEPASGLDPKARARLKAGLQALRAQGRTLFITSHLLADMVELCDRLAVLHDGSVRFIGEPAALVRRYGAHDLEQAFLECIEGAPAPEDLGPSS